MKKNLLIIFAVSIISIMYSCSNDDGVDPVDPVTDDDNIGIPESTEGQLALTAVGDTTITTTGDVVIPSMNSIPTYRQNRVNYRLINSVVSGVAFNMYVNWPESDGNVMPEGQYPIKMGTSNDDDGTRYIQVVYGAPNSNSGNYIGSSSSEGFATISNTNDKNEADVTFQVTNLQSFLPDSDIDLWGSFKYRE